MSNIESIFTTDVSIMGEYDEYMNLEYKKIQDVLCRKINHIYKNVPENIRSCIDIELSESVITSIELTKIAPNEAFLESYEDEIPRYVEQHQWADDSFYGYIWYQINKKHWIKLEFSI